MIRFFSITATLLLGICVLTGCNTPNVGSDTNNSLASHVSASATSNTTNSTNDRYKPTTQPNDRIILSKNAVKFNAAVFSHYNLSKNMFTNTIRWNVWAGDIKSNANVGVLLIFDMKQNSEDVIKVKNAGSIKITGFKNDVLFLQSNLGNGQYIIGTDKVMWSKK